MNVSVREIARVDPLAFVCCYLAAGCWLMLLAGSLAVRFLDMPAKDFDIALLFTIGLTLTAWIACRLRAARVEEIVATGERVPAMVERFFVSQWSATVTLTYEFQGKPYRRNLSLVSGRRAAAVGGRSRVTLALRPGAPRSPVILELFDAASTARGRDAA